MRFINRLQACNSPDDIQFMNHSAETAAEILFLMLFCLKFASALGANPSGFLNIEIGELIASRHFSGLRFFETNLFDSVFLTSEQPFDIAAMSEDNQNSHKN